MHRAEAAEAERPVTELQRNQMPTSKKLVACPGICTCPAISMERPSSKPSNASNSPHRRPSSHSPNSFPVLSSLSGTKLYQARRKLLLHRRMHLQLKFNLPTRSLASIAACKTYRKNDSDLYYLFLVARTLAEYIAILQRPGRSQHGLRTSITPPQMPPWTDEHVGRMNFTLRTRILAHSNHNGYARGTGSGLLAPS